MYHKKTIFDYKNSLFLLLIVNMTTLRMFINRIILIICMITDRLKKLYFVIIIDSMKSIFARLTLYWLLVVVYW